MRNRPRRFVTALTVLASLILFIGSRGINRHATAQTPTQTFSKPLETPCKGGQFLTSHAYSECGSDGFWHVVEDDYYRCPDGVDRAYRVRDTPTTQPCKPSTNSTIGSNALGYHVGINNANGLVVTTVDTPQGKIKVNLPDDMAAGDTISGTVETEPAGKDQTDRAKNQGVLNGEVIDVGGQKTKVGDKKISCVIPSTLTNEARTIVLQHNGQPVATTQIPILVTPPPTPTQLTLPTGGQQGKTIECLGNFAPTDQVKIGGTTMPPIAESPRKLVVRNTSEAVGPTTIECSQHGTVTQSPFRNIGIKLSAPKLNLRRGETSTLHVEVMGLTGITQPVPLDLVNNSPNVISMSGGNVQHINIQPTQVQANGTAPFDFTLTGIMAGAFGVTGTVIWTETYNAGPGGVIAGGPGPTSQPTPAPTPLTPTDTASGEVCKWVNYKTYRVDEFKRVQSQNANLEVRNSSAHGGGTAVEYHCKAAGTFTFTVTKESGSPDVVSVTCTQP